MPSVTCLSPIGPLTITEENGALTALTFSGGETQRPSTPLLKEAVSQLTAYFAGQRQVFELPLSPRGTAFQKQVWDALCRVPYGQTCSYGQLAHAIGRDRACRAVGMANHRNPLPIFIPCHRCVGADGSLTGYAGGLAAKKYMLQLEGAIHDSANQPFTEKL